MDPSDVLLWTKALLATGLAAFLAVFVLNNLTDPVTNSAAVHRMFSMRELRDDPDLGNGVTWRAIDSPVVHRLAYGGVVAVQAAAAVLLGWAAALLFGAAAGGSGAATAVAMGDLGLTVFTGLWLLMVVGGTWFSYWVKLGPVQQGHMTLLLVGLGSLLVMNV